ncbi:MAG: helix-turn-helix domain-containing protein [Gammaproteobacteria bacterium]|nr:helix-turn-helix domain-containing protein [Gammaproteobacteria bacterium]
MTRALSRSNHNMSEAARLLGVSRPTLYSLLSKHDLDGADETGLRSALPSADADQRQQAQCPSCPAWLAPRERRRAPLRPAACSIQADRSTSRHRNGSSRRSVRRRASGRPLVELLGSSSAQLVKVRASPFDQRSTPSSTPHRRGRSSTARCRRFR